MKNEQLYILMVICIIVFSYSLRTKYIKSSVKFSRSGKSETYKNNSNQLPKKINQSFSTNYLKSPEFTKALKKIQNIQNNTPQENTKLTQSEFIKIFQTQLQRSNEEFEQWANENADYFIRYNSIIIKELREVYNLNNLSIDDAIKTSTLLTKLNPDNKYEPELIDLYLELAGTNENHYANANLNDIAFYNLASMTFAHENAKLEICINFIDQINDPTRLQQFTEVFKSLNPNISERLEQVAQARINNNTNSASVIQTPERTPADDQQIQEN